MPLIFRWPGKAAEGTRLNTPVINEDIFPTILEMAGVKQYETVQECDGLSLARLITAGSKMVAKAQKRGEIATRKEANAFVVPASVSGVDPERELIFHYPHQYRVEDQDDIDFMSAVRKGDWKLVYRMHTGELELYNLRDDIGERNDLAASHPRTGRRTGEGAGRPAARLEGPDADGACDGKARPDARRTVKIRAGENGGPDPSTRPPSTRRPDFSVRNPDVFYRNHFVKPSAEPNAVRAMPRREMDERNSTISSSRAQSRTQFGLCRGEKWSMQTNESERPAEVRRRLCYSIPSNRQMKRTATG